MSISYASFNVCFGKGCWFKAVCNLTPCNQSPSRFLAFGSLLVCCFVFLSSASSQKISDEWIREIASPLVENQIADGLSIGYIEGSHYGIVHMGSANLTDEKPDNLTLYEIGSMSKVFTSLLLADGVVRGEIDLNDRANINNEAGIHFRSHDGREINWIDLSTHRSGLPRLPSNMGVTDLKNPYRRYDSKKAAEFLVDYSLPRQPGAEQEYSNFGASLLGYLVAQNEGQTYEKLLEERIAKPLRMSDCTVSLNRDQRKRMATPHKKFGSVASRWTFADLPGAGGIRATMRDMMRFAKAQLDPPDGKLGEAIELAWKQHTAADSSGSAMGLGWIIHADGQTRWHNGGTGGFRSAIFLNRELQCAAIVLCNTAVSDEVDLLAMQIVAKAAGHGAEPTTGRKKGKSITIDAKHRNRLVGRYQLAPGFIFTVTDEAGRLMVAATNQPTLEVVAESPTRWTAEEVKATLEFKLNKTGPAESLTLIQSGMEQVALRMEDDENAVQNQGDDVVIDAEHRARLVGRYELTPDFIMTVADEQGTLTVTATNQATLTLTPDSPTKWSNDAVKAMLEFRLPKTGSARSLVLHQGGAKQVARRMKEAKDSKVINGAGKEIAIDRALRKRLEGQYQLTPNFIFTVTDKEGRLMVGITNQPTQEVFPDSATEWSYRGVKAMLEFDLTKPGPAKSLVLHQNGAEQRARRIK